MKHICCRCGRSFEEEKCVEFIDLWWCDYCFDAFIEAHREVAIRNNAKDKEAAVRWLQTFYKTKDKIH